MFLFFVYMVRLTKTTFCKNFKIPGETKTRNVYSRVCGHKTRNCCSSVFFIVGQGYRYVISEYFENTESFPYYYAASVSFEWENFCNHFNFTI